MSTRSALVAAGCAVVAGATLAFPQTASADVAGDCLANGGVWVMVSGVASGCAWNPGSGYAALQAIGVQPNVLGSGFICQMSGVPGTCSDGKDGGYWSYWHANGSSSAWYYSNLGAEAYVPRAGTVDAWWWVPAGSGDISGGQPPLTAPIKTVQQAQAPAPEPAQPQAQQPEQAPQTDTGQAAPAQTAPTQAEPTSGDTASATATESSASPSEDPSSSASATPGSNSASPEAGTSSASASPVARATVESGQGSGWIGWSVLGAAVLGGGGFLGWKRWHQPR